METVRSDRVLACVRELSEDEPFVANSDFIVRSSADASKLTRFRVSTIAHLETSGADDEQMRDLFEIAAYVGERVAKCVEHSEHASGSRRYEFLEFVESRETAASSNR